LDLQSGLELEVMARPLPWLTYTSNMSLLHGNYCTFTNASVAAGIIPYLAGNPRYHPTTGFYDATANRLNWAPRFSTLQALQMTASLLRSISARAEMLQSRTYYD